MKKLFVGVILTTFHYMLVAQDKSQISFTSNFAKCSQDKIKLEVKNLSSTKTFYYYIGAQGVVDTGYIPLLSDIKSIGQNGFLKLMPLNPNKNFIQFISKKRITKMCACHIAKIRFYIVYFNKPNFESESKIIWIAPI